MAVCPYCHTQDKNFFAPKCHACNTPVGFWQQVEFSLIWTVTQVLVVVGVLWLAKIIIF